MKYEGKLNFYIKASRAFNIMRQKLTSSVKLMLYLVGNNKADQYLSLKKFREKLFFIDIWYLESQKTKFDKNSTSDLVIK